MTADLLVVEDVVPVDMQLNIWGYAITGTLGGPGVYASERTSNGWEWGGHLWDRTAVDLACVILNDGPPYECFALPYLSHFGGPDAESAT